MRDRRQGEGPRHREAGEQGIETEALKVIDGETGRGAREGCMVIDKATEKENY